MKSSQSIIKHYSMSKHPEGGYYREMYRAEDKVSGQGFENRSASTCIYFLLERFDKSKFHKIKQDEIWHFYFGVPIVIHQISHLGIYSKTVLGSSNEYFDFQAVIRKNTWMAATPIDCLGYSLIGCTVAPGFEFADFEMADRDLLIKQYPNLEDIIIEFT